MVHLRRFGLRHRVALSFLGASMLVALPAVAIGTAMVGAVVTSADRDTAALIASQVATAVAESGGPGRAPQHGNQSAAPDSDVLHLIDQVPLGLPHVYGPQRGPASAELTVNAIGIVVSTTYPGRFPAGAYLETLVPAAGTQLPRVLEGKPAGGEAAMDGGEVAWSMQPVLASDSGDGAVYVQVTEPQTANGFLVQPFLLSLLTALAVLTPVGVAFGVLTMRGVVGRIRGLVDASQALAAGEFSKRVRPRGGDELTTLQRQFNTMAAQLEEAVERLQDLAADHARLAERDRIARDFHDSISQELFSLRMTVGALEIDRAAQGTLRDRLQDVGRSLAGVIRQMRVVLLELCPPPAAGADLPAALAELVAVYRSRVGLAVDADIQPLDVSGAARDGLLRVAQEALANAARHSGAERVQVVLRGANGDVELRVADDGHGFEPTSAEARRGLGLRGLEERACEMGGTLRIDSAPGCGTLVVVRTPR